MSSVGLPGNRLVSGFRERLDADRSQLEHLAWARHFTYGGDRDLRPATDAVNDCHSGDLRSRPMKNLAVALTIAFILTLMPSGNFASAEDAKDQQVSTKDLKTLEVPGKVVAVLWTRRPGRCTLQIVFPNLSRIAQAAGDPPRPGLRRPKIQAWLLGADGSTIAPIGQSEPAGNGRQPFGVEVLIAYPRSADAEAVAVALRVDDKYLIQPLAAS